MNSNIDKSAKRASQWLSFGCHSYLCIEDHHITVPVWGWSLWICASTSHCTYRRTNAPKKLYYLIQVKFSIWQTRASALLFTVCYPQIQVKFSIWQIRASALLFTVCYPHILGIVRPLLLTMVKAPVLSVKKQVCVYECCEFLQILPILGTSLGPKHNVVSLHFGVLVWQRLYYFLT